MSALKIINAATKAGIRLQADCGKLIVEFSGEVPDAIVARLKQYKPEILALLRQAASAVRPAGYSDAEWLAAVADATRLGYPPREAAQ